MSVFFLDFLGTRQSDVQRYQKTVLSFLVGEMSKIVPSISLHFHLGNNTYMCGLPTLRAFSKIVCHFSKHGKVTKTNKLGHLIVNILDNVENLRLYGAH